MRISDWSSDVCSSDLEAEGAAFVPARGPRHPAAQAGVRQVLGLLQPRQRLGQDPRRLRSGKPGGDADLRSVDEAVRRRRGHRGGVAQYRQHRSEEHTSELQSLMRISYAVFCLKKKTKNTATIAD